MLEIIGVEVGINWYHFCVNGVFEAGFRADMLHHPISRGPQSPRLLRAASFSAVIPSNKGVYGFSFSSLCRGKETAFGSRNGGGKHAFSPFVSIAVVISPRLFVYDMAGDFKRWRTRLFLPFPGFPAALILSLNRRFEQNAVVGSASISSPFNSRTPDHGIVSVLAKKRPRASPPDGLVFFPAIRFGTRAPAPPRGAGWLSSPMQRTAQTESLSE